jgi:hypothetical protein
MSANRAFTVGNPEQYDAAIDAARRDSGFLIKIGAHEGYEGGIVFPNLQSVEAWLTAHKRILVSGDEEIEVEGYSVELPTNWETDVFPSPCVDGSFRLKNDAKILGKITAESHDGI